MDRRSFLRGLGMVVAGVAIDQAIPLGRVWSFPTKIKLASSADCIAIQAEHVRNMIAHFKYTSTMVFLNPDDIYIHPAQREAYLELAKPDPYAHIREMLRIDREEDPDFRITGITVPQGE